MKVTYFAQTVKVGNSIYVKIPKKVRTICEIENGDYVRIEVQKIGYTEIITERGDKDDESLHDNCSAPPRS